GLQPARRRAARVFRRGRAAVSGPGLASSLEVPGERRPVPLAALEGLSLQFARQPVAVLEEVSLHIHRGERVGIVGESGCGKSLTMLALMGLLPSGARVTGGTLSVAGSVLPPAAWGHARRPSPGLAMIFQQPTAALNPVFTVGDQLLAVARTQPDGRRKARTALVADCLKTLEQVRLSD